MVEESIRHTDLECLIRSLFTRDLDDEGSLLTDEEFGGLLLPLVGREDSSQVSLSKVVTSSHVVTQSFNPCHQIPAIPCNNNARTSLLLPQYLVGHLENHHVSVSWHHLQHVAFQFLVSFVFCNCAN
uniref:Uncharacterized protein n=1 Tax=Photinus pyralis TaxID=7054 RepID=A0A1Y1MAF6_PHOPY